MTSETINYVAREGGYGINLNIGDTAMKRWIIGRKNTQSYIEQLANAFSIIENTPAVRRGYF
jgi:hypothetical protein